jgi:hypothetical protein
MAHTHIEDFEDHFNTLQSNFTETQQEVKQLSVNVVTINTNMQSSTFALIEDFKQDITTHVEFFVLMIYTKMHIPVDNPLSDLSPHTEV